MAEIRVNTTGTLKLFDADDSHSAGIAAGTVTANETLMTLNTADITFSIPKIVIGDATAEDTSIVFDGNAQDFYIGLDDSADDLIIGLGSAVGTTPIISVDENKDVSIPDGGLTITTSDNTAQLTLISTDADASTGPILKLLRDSGSPADNDLCAVIKLNGDNDANEDTQCYEIRAAWNDVSNGTEDGAVRHALMVGGTLRDVMTLDSGIAVFNEEQQDINFKVEGTGNINLLFVDAGEDSVYINASAQQADEKFLVNNNDNSKGLFSRCTSGSQTGDTVHFDANRAGSSAYNFIRIQSGNSTDSEFIFTGEGNAFADGSFSGGGADYAEYFEWKDGNSSDEDRVGCSVILDGNKIVKATDSDDASKIIGVISACPVVVGDSDIEQWLQKYEKDELNRFIWEDYESVIWFDEKGKDTFYHVDRVPDDVTIPDDAIYYRTEDDGVTKLKRKKLNSAYDASKNYVSRKDRKEWDTVGLVGKLRIKKGQPTGTNWIKMKDISETVEEWLVR
tara:strand:- start:21 stop:1544 length:1524 start_codon:yes stop_codon:yes gene_type:complete